MGLLLPVYLIAFPFMVIEELLALLAFSPALICNEVYELVEKVIG